MKERTLAPICEYSQRKGIHCGLIILIELSDSYYSGGCRLTNISKKYNFPLYTLLPIIYKMEEAGLISHKTCDPDWLFLEKEPQDKWILEVVSTLKILFKTEE